MGKACPVAKLRIACGAGFSFSEKYSCNFKEIYNCKGPTHPL